MVDLSNTKELLASLNLLYVEDDKPTAEAMSRFLQKRVKKFYYTSNGEYGLEVFKTHKIDVIVTDIKMPYMDGFEMVTAIKKIKKDVKVIFVSAYHEDQLFLKAINLGADGFLIKPISVNTSLVPILEKAAANITKERLLNEYTKTLKLILDYVDNMVVVTDGSKLYNANRAFYEFFGVSGLKEFNTKFKRLYEIFSSKQGYVSHFNWLEQVEKNADAKVAIQDHIFLLHAKKIEIESSVEKYVVNFTDITSLENEKDLLKESASKDSVTQFINMDIFKKLYDKQIEYLKQRKGAFYIVNVTIMNLEQINMSLNYEKADGVLKEVSTLIKQYLSEALAMTRWVGGKFLILLPDAKEGEIVQKTKKLQEVLINHHYKSGSTVEIKTKFKLIQESIELNAVLEGLK